MRNSQPVKRYTLARAGVAKTRPYEGLRKLRLVRMEEIAEADRDRERRTDRAS